MIFVSWKIRQLVFGILSVLALFTRSLHAEDAPIRHEIVPVFSWSSYGYVYDDYVVNGEAAPLVSGNYDRDYQEYSFLYSFFFTPISNSPNIPNELRQFYSRPATLRLHFTSRPEYEKTHIFQNLGVAYRKSTISQPTSRNAGVELELFPWKHTGLSLSVNSIKSEESLNWSSTLEFRGEGETNEIQRQYGLGVSQYIGEHFRFSVKGALSEREHVSVENSWEEKSPLLKTEYGSNTEGDGREFQLSGMYVFRNIASLSGGYRYYRSDSHSKTSSSYYENFSAGESFYNDDASDHVFQMAVEMYWKKNSSLRVGGGFRRYELERIYETDQNVLYEWNIWSVNTRISHDIARRFGLWCSYEFATRDGSVETWHPESENTQGTTYQTSSDLHLFQVGIKITM